MEKFTNSYYPFIKLLKKVLFQENKNTNVGGGVGWEKRRPTPLVGGS